MHTLESRLKMSRIAKEKGRRPPSWQGRKHSPESIKKMSEAKRGNVPNENQRRGLEVGRKVYDEERRRKIGFRKSGPNCNWWKGGVSAENRTARQNLSVTIDYTIWRRSVFERDNYTCQECGKKGGTLNADHIKPFILYPELRLEVSNGRTLCVNCHKAIGWKHTGALQARDENGRFMFSKRVK